VEELRHKSETIASLELSNKNLTLELNKVRKELDFYKNMCKMYEGQMNNGPQKPPNIKSLDIDIEKDIKLNVAPKQPQRPTSARKPLSSSNTHSSIPKLDKVDKAIKKATGLLKETTVDSNIAPKHKHKRPISLSTRNSSHTVSTQRERGDKENFIKVEENEVDRDASDFSSKYNN